MAYCNERLKVIHQDCDRFGIKSDITEEVTEDDIVNVVEKEGEIVESDV